jgi:MYXO-CTERM domain-containing protein
MSTERAGTCTTTCNFDADCTSSMPSKPYCLRATSSDAGVDGGDAEVDGGDAELDAAEVEAGTPSMNICVECRADADCAARTDERVKCVGADHTCAQCSSTDTSSCSASGVGSACLGTGLCGCSSDADCATDRRCDTTASKCEPRPVEPDAGVDAGADAGADAGDSSVAAPPAAADSEGCGCRTTGRASNGGAASLALLAIAAIAARRRRGSSPS